MSATSVSPMPTHTTNIYTQSENLAPIKLCAETPRCETASRNVQNDCNASMSENLQQFSAHELKTDRMCILRGKKKTV
jgi:hypothetical protein